MEIVLLIMRMIEESEGTLYRVHLAVHRTLEDGRVREHDVYRRRRPSNSSFFILLAILIGSRLGCCQAV